MWDIKYRPLRFSDVLGQDGAIHVLRNRLKAGTAKDTSYIFSGGHGQGKTTLARILARAILCENLGEDGEPCNACDNCQAVLTETSAAFAELDAASNGTIDKVRSIVDDLAFSVYGSDKRIYLFDEAHRMSRDAQDVLLKPVEDKRMIAILCTTEAEKIRGTIRSRCEEHVIRRVPREAILARMQSMMAAEAVPFEDDAILTVIDFCNGHIRDIINRLGTLAQMGPVSLEAVRENLHLGMVPVYYQILLALTEPGKAVELVDRACDTVVPDEVASGLAEAAMNSYRVANGMFASFTSVDRALAVEAHTKYGAAIVPLAEHFSRSRYNTKVALLCDVLTALTTRSAAPTRVQVVVEQAAASPVVSPAAAGPVVASPAAAEPPVARGPNVRPDGKGPLGEDPYALTKLDHKAIPQTMPRGHRALGQQVSVEGVVAPIHDMLTTDEWRREFERLWPSGRGV